MYKEENNNDMIITHIKNNWRYRILRYENKIYLLDASTYWYSLILFTVNPLFPMNGYEIDNTTVKRIKEKLKDEADINFSKILLISSLSSLLGILIKSSFKKITPSDKFNFIFIYLLPVILTLFYLISRYSKKKQLIELIGKQNNKKRIRFCNPPERKRETDEWVIYTHSVLVWLLVFSFVVFLGRRIMGENSEPLDYFWYFVVILCWAFGSMHVDIGKKYFKDMTVVIKDK